MRCVCRVCVCVHVYVFMIVVSTTYRTQHTIHNTPKKHTTHTTKKSTQYTIRNTQYKKPHTGGMDPVNELFAKYKNCNEDSLGNHAGNVPLRPLFDANMVVRFCNDVMVSGRGPVRARPLFCMLK